MTVGSKDEHSGEVVFHIGHHAHSNYATLCGVSTDDDCFTPVPVPKGQKINCKTCHAIWVEARLYRYDDFTEELK